MTGVRARGEDIRRFILNHVEEHPKDVSKLAADHFGITRQAVNKHLQKLTAEHALAETGNTRNRTYKLASLSEWRRIYEISPGVTEGGVWATDIRAVLGQLPENVLSIWQYGFTEMFNNAIDHSDGTAISVTISKTAANTEMLMHDNGVGIFKKIQTALGLLDERHAVLELAKGKFTTDPKNHTGEGIFFSSRMFDKFRILSGGVFFSHDFGDDEDWILAGAEQKGTYVRMQLSNHTARAMTKIFDQFSSGDDYGFNKTIVPVELAQYGDDKLISRSQAKRLLARIELFKTVMLDFSGVEVIGQAFADEIFRVFSNAHPEIELIPIHANSAVKRMTERAKAGAAKRAGARVAFRKTDAA